MADTYQEIEAEIPRLRRYARALTRDVVLADDLVQDCLTRATGKLHLWQERYGSARVAVYDSSQPICQSRAPLPYVKEPGSD